MRFRVTGEEKREGIREAGTYRDVLAWKRSLRRISTPCLQSVHSSEIYYSFSSRISHPKDRNHGAFSGGGKKEGCVVVLM